jgi:hypothetical protein
MEPVDLCRFKEHRCEPLDGHEARQESFWNHRGGSLWMTNCGIDARTIHQKTETMTKNKRYMDEGMYKATRI